MPTAALNGTDLFHVVDGEGRPTLVLHGGLGIDHTRYRRTLGPLSPPLQLIYLDHRGNGRSGRPPLDTITMPQLADDVVALADHLGIERFVALGHSYGGFVAQELAIRHRDRVEALLLLDTTPGQLGANEREEDTEAGPPQPPELAEAMSSLPTTDAEYAEGMARLLPFYLHRCDMAAAHALEAETIWDVAAMVQGFVELSQWSSVDRLETITCPTLVVAGRHDVFTSWPQAHRIASRIPNADVHVFEHSGHYPWFDEPDAFFDVVRGWLTDTFG